VLYGKAGWMNGKYKEAIQIKPSDGIGYSCSTAKLFVKSVLHLDTILAISYELNMA